MSRRLSFGGQVVESGLRAMGARPEAAADVALVETATPRHRAFRAVLAQNAWNVVDAAEFDDLIGRLPPPHRRRVRMRRALAQVNVRRAGHVVCLSETMARWTRRISPRVVVAPVTVPVDLTTSIGTAAPVVPAGAGAPSGAEALVPGTLTWHKNPVAAVRPLADRGVRRIDFLGSDDGSGAWAAVRRACAERAVDGVRSSVDRDGMIAAVSGCGVVVVPSRLESLSLSLAEALVLAPDVIASRIPAHEELAERLGRQPAWLEADGTVTGRCGPRPELDPQRVRGQWREVAVALGLLDGAAR